MDLSDTCEWNPEDNRAALDTDEGHAPAVLSVGANGKWHLCEACADLPKFRRLRSRRRLRNARVPDSAECDPLDRGHFVTAPCVR